MAYYSFVIKTLLTLVFVVSVMFFSAFYIHKQDVVYTENDLIRKYQFSKIDAAESVKVVILGDSSAGNAIEAATFEELSGLRTKNLALTGSFGFAGTYNLIRHVHEHHPSATIIIIHTPDIWDREFAEQGYFETIGHLSDTLSIANKKGLVFKQFRYVFNPKEIGWYFRHLLKPEKIPQIYNDYLTQGDATFANGRKQEVHELVGKIHPDKVSVFKSIDIVCGSLDIDCVYLHGPIHEATFERSKNHLDHINDIIHGMNHIQVINTIFSYPSSMMGNAIDHVSPPARKQVTEDYYSKIIESTSVLGDKN